MDVNEIKPDPFADTRKLLSKISEDVLKEKDPETLMELSLGLAQELRKTLRIIIRLEADKEKLELSIKGLQEAQKPAYKYAGYPGQKDFIAKLIFILSKNDQGMSFEDIVSAFFDLEPDLKDRWTNPAKSISKIISRACKFSVIDRRKAYGEHGYFAYSIPRR